MSVIVGGIDTKDISVVVQGAIDKKITPKCLKSIRNFLPDAEIILSTWENSNVEELDYDVLVSSKDPGNDGIQAYSIEKTYLCNLNRQLLSTKEGLKQSSRKYIIKIRTDFFLTSNDFLQYFELFNTTTDLIFNHRVIVLSVFSRRYSDQNGVPMPFHVSDLFFFGLKDDIKNYFSETELINSEFTDYKFQYPHKVPYFLNTMRYAPEQYFCIEWLKRNGIDVNFNDWTCWNQKILDFSDKILFSNFIFLNSLQAGIDSYKHHNNLFKEFNYFFGIISNKLFIEEFEKRFSTKINLISVEYKNNHPINVKKIFKLLLTPIRYPIRLLKVPIKLFIRFIKWC